MLASQRSQHLKEVVALKEQLVQAQLKLEQRSGSPTGGDGKATGEDRRQVATFVPRFVACLLLMTRGCAKHVPAFREPHAFGI